MPRTAVPLRAVDEVAVLSADEAVATKRIVHTDPYLAGHYPGQVLYPGVFVLESVRQTLDALLTADAGSPVVATLTGISSMRLFAPLAPGDPLTVEVRCGAGEAGERTATARCLGAGGEQVAQLSIRFVAYAPGGRR